MPDQVIFYDLPSKEGFCWSLNPWKTRLALNIKEVPYKTEWIEYPDLKPTFQKFGIPQNTSGPYDYSSPTIQLPNGAYVMESRAIVTALESLHPTPSLNLSSPYLPKIEATFPQLQGALRPVFVPLVPKTFLNSPSKAYFTRTREATLKMSLDEYSQGAGKAFEDVKPFIKQLGEMYAENGDGPFLDGKDVGYADVIILGLLRMLYRLEVVDKIWAMDGGKELKVCYEAAGKWLERDSY